MGAGSTKAKEKMTPLGYEKPCKEGCLFKQIDTEVGDRKILNTGQPYYVLLCPSCKRHYLRLR